MVRKGQILNEQTLNAAFMSKTENNSIIGDITATGKTIRANVLIADGNIGVGVTGPVEKIEANGKIKATSFISTVAIGTAPFTVTSTTKVANLNADLFDDKDSTEFMWTTHIANTITALGGTSLALGAASNGSGTVIALANHVHPTTGLMLTTHIANSITALGGTSLALGAASNGSGTVVALANHVHPTTGLMLTTHAANSITGFGTSGTSTLVSRDDHGHLNFDADTVDGKHVWIGLQADYNAIAVKDENTLYYITDADDPIDADTLNGLPGSRYLSTGIEDVTYYVRTDGNDNNEGLSDTASGAFKTIQKALSMCPKVIKGCTYTIRVATGDYVADGALVISGFVGDGGMLTIVGVNYVSPAIVHSIMIRDCTVSIDIRYFTANPPTNLYGDIAVYRCADVYMERLKCERTSTYPGIIIGVGANTMAYKCTASNRGVGILCDSGVADVQSSLGTNNTVAYKVSEGNMSVDLYEATLAGTTMYLNDNGVLKVEGKDYVKSIVIDNKFSIEYNSTEDSLDFIRL